jgi:hypothetical protein
MTTNHMSVLNLVAATVNVSITVHVRSSGFEPFKILSPVSPSRQHATFDSYSSVELLVGSFTHVTAATLFVSVVGLQLVSSFILNVSY